MFLFNLLYALVVTSYMCLLKPHISVLFNLLYVLALQLKDANGLHALVGDAIFEMIDRKKVIFPKATLSRKNYLSMAPSYDFCVLMPVPVQQEGTTTLAKLLNGGLQVQCLSIPALYAQGHRDPRQNPTFPGSTTGFATG